MKYLLAALTVVAAYKLGYAMGDADRLDKCIKVLKRIQAERRSSIS